MLNHCISETFMVKNDLKGNENPREFSNKKTGYTSHFILKILLALAMLFSFSFAMHPESVCAMQEGNLEVTPEVTLRCEYDDNVTLANRFDEKREDDFIWHISPALNFLLPYKEHGFFLNFNADYRKGTDTDLKDLNLNASGGINFDFPGGLHLKLKDTYNKNSFDMALYQESGTSKSNSNTYGIETMYSISERIQVGANYDHTWEKFEEETEPLKRDIDTFESKLSFPLSNQVVSYITYYFQQQDSPQRRNKDYDDSRYLLGARWTGAYRFSVWIEGGYEKIDYKPSTERDFSKSLGNMGIEIRFSEVSQCTLSLGKDGYGNTTYEGSILYQPADETSVRLSLNKKTQRSFSGVFLSDAYESTNVNLQLSKKFVERITVTLEGSYQLQDSSSDTIQNQQNQKDKIWVLRMGFDYPIRDWAKVGMDYQYATKKSTHAEYEYNDARVGVFSTLHF